jgi:hypothetical protein
VGIPNLLAVANFVPSIPNRSTYDALSLTPRELCVLASDVRISLAGVSVRAVGNLTQNTHELVTDVNAIDRAVAFLYRQVSANISQDALAVQVRQKVGNLSAQTDLFQDVASNLDHQLAFLNGQVSLYGNVL